MTTAIDPKKIRKEMRRKRAEISKQEQRARSLLAFNQLKRSGLLLRFQTICAYLSDRGEIAPEVFFEALWKSGKDIVLPILHPIYRDRMLFVRYNKGDALHANRYGILEPTLNLRKILPARNGGLVLCPLTAFDSEGLRLGMGGGFYDRSFSFKLHSEATQPFLAGLAYDFQKVEHLEAMPWDVRLDAVITDVRCYLPRKNKR